jgi:uncharacterized delta-60 repeat protein
MKKFNITTIFLILIIIFPKESFPQSGRIDSTFGQNGVVCDAINVIGSSTITSTALQPDGKIVAAGYTYIEDQHDFALARYNTDGSRDISFGTNGIVITSVSDGNDYSNSIAVQTDGKIIAAGSTVQSGQIDFALARYNPNGKLDQTFGIDGIVTTKVSPSTDIINSIAIQEDGKIVAAGYTQNGSKDDICLARYDMNGILDNTFGSNGIIIVPSPASSDGINSVKIQEDGKILCGGNSDIGGTSDFTLIRYNTDGILDSTFGLNGIVITPGPISDDHLYSIAVQKDGKIIAAGSSTLAGTRDFALVRYNPDGKPDSTFGINGIVLFIGASSDDEAMSVAVQDDAKIIAAGFTDNGILDFAMVRYNTNGTLDTTFGTHGVVITPVSPANDICNSSLIQTDGKIIAAGGSIYTMSKYQFALLRYNPDGEPDDSFGESGRIFTPIGKAENKLVYKMMKKSL